VTSGEFLSARSTQKRQIPVNGPKSGTGYSEKSSYLKIEVSSDECRGMK
jgi:hypothetical protein